MDDLKTLLQLAQAPLNAVFSNNTTNDHIALGDLLISINNATGGGVTSLNSLAGALTLVAGANVIITPSGSSLVISSTGGGGGAVWGTIAGTLSNQTDLQNALNAKQNSLTFGNLTASAPFTITGGSAAVIGSGIALAVTSGYYFPTTTDEANWNSKQAALTPGSISTSTTGVTVGSGANSTVGPNVTVDVQTASGSQPGLLAAADWTTFNNKQPALGYVPVNKAGDTMSGTLGVPALIDYGLTPSAAVVTDPSKELVSSSTTATELGYVHGVISPIQAQLDSKLPAGFPTSLGTVALGPPSSPIAAGTTYTYVISLGATYNQVLLTNFQWIAANATQPAQPGVALGSAVFDPLNVGPMLLVDTTPGGWKRCFVLNKPEFANGSATPLNAPIFATSGGNNVPLGYGSVSALDVAFDHVEVETGPPPAQFQINDVYISGTNLNIVVKNANPTGSLTLAVYAGLSRVYGYQGANNWTTVNDNRMIAISAAEPGQGCYISNDKGLTWANYPVLDTMYGGNQMSGMTSWSDSDVNFLAFMDYNCNFLIANSPSYVWSTPSSTGTWFYHINNDPTGTSYWTSYGAIPEQQNSTLGGKSFDMIDSNGMFFSLANYIDTYVVPRLFITQDQWANIGTNVGHTDKNAVQLDTFLPRIDAHTSFANTDPQSFFSGSYNRIIDTNTMFTSFAYYAGYIPDQYQITTVPNTGTQPEIQQVIAVADVGGSLAGTAFTIYDSSNNPYVVWYKVSGIGSAPAVAGVAFIEVDINTNDTNDAVAIATAAACAASSPFNTAITASHPGIPLINFATVAECSNPAFDGTNPTFTPPVSYVSDGSTEAIWGFTEGTGVTVGDTGPNGLNGTIETDNNWTSGYNSQSCLNFDGLTWVDVPYSPFLYPSADMTIEIWFQTGGVNYTPTALIDTSGQGSNYGYSLWIDPSNNNALTGFLQTNPGGSCYVYGTTSVTDNNWHHAALVRQGNTVTLWLDGNLQAMNTVGAGDFTGQTNDLWIGQFNAPSSQNQFTGNIQQIRLSDSARYQLNDTNFGFSVIQNAVAMDLLQSSWFTIDQACSATGHQYYFWFNSSGGGTDPNPNALSLWNVLRNRVGVPVAINSGDSASTVASTLSAAIVGTGDFTTTVQGNTLYIVSTKGGNVQHEALDQTAWGINNTTTGFSFINIDNQDGHSAASQTLLKTTDGGSTWSEMMTQTDFIQAWNRFIYVSDNGNDIFLAVMGAGYGAVGYSGPGTSYGGNNLTPHLIRDGVFDSSPNFNNGYANYTGVTPAAGLINNAASFDGVAGYIGIPTGVLNNLPTGTISCWVNLTTNTNGGVIAIQQDGLGTAILSIGDSPAGPGTAGVVYFQNGSGQSINSVGTITTGGWHHIAVVFSNTVGIIYIDGVMDTTVAANFNIANFNSPNNSTIGAWLSSGGSVFDVITGLVDDMAIFNAVLTPTQIATIHTNGLAHTGISSAVPNLLALYRFDESIWVNSYPYPYLPQEMRFNKSTDGGATWAYSSGNWVLMTNKVNANYTIPYAFCSEQLIYASGNNILSVVMDHNQIPSLLRSTDGGATWSNMVVLPPWNSSPTGRTYQCDANDAFCSYAHFNYQATPTVSYTYIGGEVDTFTSWGTWGL